MRTSRRYVLIAAALVAAVGAAVPYLPAAADEPAPEDPPVVQVAEGTLRGERHAGTTVFRNIPFAAPPVGELRWRAPQPPSPWSGIRDATQPGPRCPQFDPGQPDGVAGSEDCLHLTVQAPPPGPEQRPVMVFVHGGAFTVGAGADYDATRLASQGDVVAVTINYRLGALGFLDHPDLADPAAGNYGLADQQAALHWVRHNIAAFGGDPADVTLWGESAGAFSTCAQFAAPAARGLFHKAIVQSGPCGTTMLTRPQARARATSYAAKLGCSGSGVVACLRGVPDTALIKGTPFGGGLSTRLTDLAWSPVVGTPLLPEQPLAAIRAGAADGIPLLHGGTRDEMRGFVAGRYDQAGSPLTAAQYPGAIREIYGARTAPAILARYPVDRYPAPGAALATVLTDDGSFLGACRQLTANAAVGTPTVYAYEFAQPDGRRTTTFPLGAYHGSDTRYLFDIRRAWAPPPLTPEEQPLGERMVRYWTTFAHTGRPAADWPRYAHGQALALTHAGETPVDLAREHRCDFWQDRAPVVTG